jgi:hypothetical protein
VGSIGLKAHNTGVELGSAEAMPQRILFFLFVIGPWIEWPEKLE